MPYRRWFISLIAVFAFIPFVKGQQPEKSLRYVLPEGSGALNPDLKDLEPQTMSLFDGGSRLAAQFTKAGSDLTVSYLIFRNETGASTADSCRDAVINPILQNLVGKAEISGLRRSRSTAASGLALSVAEYTVVKAGAITLDQINIFGFYGDAATCFEVHVSNPRFRLADRPALDAMVDHFRFEPGYTPSAADYGVIGTLFFNYFKDYQAAKVYYQRTFETLPTAEITSPTASVLGRITVVQLGITFAISGDLAQSRKLNEAAIARDPQFPLYYYNLACADAETGDAKSAKLHLQQAFDRKENMLPSVDMPDPTHDDSILKLKNNREFWSFVESLKTS